jgi:hypothetical protein
MFAHRIAAAVCVAAIATAAPAADDVTLKSVRFGEAITGKKQSPDDLKGKVVLVEFWGIN